MNRTYYYLFHLTNYYLGCEIMKGSFAKYNQGRVEYRGKTKDQMTFFDYDNIKIEEIKDYLLSAYEGVKKIFLDIIEEQIDETPYLVKHIRQALKDLELEGKVKIKREPKFTKRGKERKSILSTDEIIF